MSLPPGIQPPWVGRPQVTLISLIACRAGSRAAMVANVAGGKALPQEIVEEITDRTDGVPLFIEELTKAVLESGLLVEAGDRYVATGPVTAAGDPDIAACIADGAAGSPGAAKDVAQTGAAIGREFSHELIGVRGGDAAAAAATTPWRSSRTPD